MVPSYKLEGLYRVPFAGTFAICRVQGVGLEDSRNYILHITGNSSPVITISMDLGLITGL